MRLSMERGDRGYDEARGRRAIIYLNGRRQPPGSPIVTADEERGLIVRYARGEDGRLRRCACGSGWVQEIVFGCVRIVVPECV